MLRLATKGNPTALLPLYAPPESVIVLTPLGEELRALAPAVLSQRAVARFLAIANTPAWPRSAIACSGGRRSDVPNRPELVARYGYDVKYASHALRLAYQGREIVRDGRLTLPMPAVERERVLQVKRGDVPVLAEVLEQIDDVQAEIERLLGSGDTPLPAEPDLDAVSAWAVGAHQRHWRAVAVRPAGLC